MAPAKNNFHDEFFYAEFPMVEWLEENGYDVSYFTDVDADRSGSLIENHQIWMDAGHDEYWSGNEFNNIMARSQCRRRPRLLQRQYGVLEDLLLDQHRRLQHAGPDPGLLQGNPSQQRGRRGAQPGRYH